MPEACITLRVKVPSVQKLTALRDKCADYIDEDKDATVVASSSAIDEQQWTVFGTMRGKPDETWQDTVYAPSEEEAAPAAVDEDSKRVVAKVLVGVVS